LVQNKPIAGQCCVKGEGGNANCRRYTKGEGGGDANGNNAKGCIASKSPAVAMSYTQTRAKCTELGLDMCDRPCSGTGCGYDINPVWTDLPCSPADVATRPWAVQVLDGGGKRSPGSTCITDPETTLVQNKPIAGQCCVKGEGGNANCRRYTKGEGGGDANGNNAKGCIASKSPAVAMSYTQTRAKCTELGLDMCDRPCSGTGCGYDSNPVWTDLPCSPAAKEETPPPASVETPPPPASVAKCKGSCNPKSAARVCKWKVCSGCEFCSSPAAKEKTPPPASVETPPPPASVAECKANTCNPFGKWIVCKWKVCSGCEFCA